jgi:hypothetical protein
MVAIITGWKAELLKAIRQAVAEGHLSSSVDAPQMVFEIYGLMLAMHQDARLLRSADSAKRARAALARLLASATKATRTESKNRASAARKRTAPPPPPPGRSAGRSQRTSRTRQKSVATRPARSRSRAAKE